MATIPAPVYLWISVLLFAASNSVVRILGDLGAQHSIEGHNPISFCNLLFAGNTCAVVALSLVYWKQWTAENLRRLSRGDWISLVALAVLTSAIAPWLFFVAIQNTMVTSVVLIAQIEPPLVLLLSWLVFRERVGVLSTMGAALAFFGVVLSVLLQPAMHGFMIGKGELCAAAAATLYALSTIIAKPRVAHIPLGIFTVFRNAFGAVVFFCVATYIYGPEHFMDLTAPFLWEWMLVYGGLIIVCGQLAWFNGLKTARSIDVSLATSAAPVAGVLAAFVILGERPMTSQYIGGAVLLIGIAVGLLGGRIRRPEAKPEPVAPADAAPSALAAECKTGFKGI